MRRPLAQARQRLADGGCAVARRVDQHAVEPVQRQQVVRCQLEQVARAEADLVREPVVARILQRTRSQRRAPFDAQDFPRAGGNGQREIAQAAEQVGDALVGLRVEQGHGARYQRAVDLMVDLGEVGRLERHLDAEFRQVV